MKKLEEMATQITGSVGTDPIAFYDIVISCLEYTYRKGVKDGIEKLENEQLLEDTV